MGWQNPPVPWRELEQKLSDRAPIDLQNATEESGARVANKSVSADVRRQSRQDEGVERTGGDSPAWSRKREEYQPPEDLEKVAGGSEARGATMSVSADVGENSSSSLKSQQVTAYAELHCHSNFSFLDGASDPEGLVEEAVRLGLSALALTDRNGFYLSLIHI